MIKGSFKRTGSGRIVSFELTGHAEAGPYGSDGLRGSFCLSN